MDIRAEEVPPSAKLKMMVRHRLNELDKHIQEMVALRQKLAERYVRIDSRLLDTPASLNEDLRQGKICGLIEQAMDGNC